MTTPTATTTPAPSEPTIAEAVASCRADVPAEPFLTSGEQAQLDHLCETALTSGNPDSPDILAVERQICLTIVQDSGVTGAAAATARQNCAATGQIGPPSGATGATGATGGTGSTPPIGATPQP